MNIIATFVNALFLREDAYVRMRDTNRALLIGLVVIVVLALLVSILALVGDVIEVATGPDLGQIKDAVWRYMITSSWWKQIPPEGQRQAQQGFELWWNMSPLFGAPNPVGKAFDLVVRPVIWLADWLIFGVIAFVLARFVFKGEGRLPAFLGVLALAVTPQVFQLLQILPGVNIDGLLLNLWSLCCAYLAIKASFGLSVARSFWATLVTWLLALIPFFLISGFFTAIVGGVQMVLSGLPK